MPNVAKNIGANRIVAGVAITHPLGAPEKRPEEEKALRKKIVRAALELMSVSIESQIVINNWG